MRRDPGPAGCDFYPRSPCGERPAELHSFCQFSKFLSTLSLRRATVKIFTCGDKGEISIHALLAESDAPCPRCSRGTLPISIHALLAESDLSNNSRQYLRLNFYPRSPCGERRPPIAGMPTVRIFLSTLSLRRATRAAWPKWPSMQHFYPRSPCGERPLRQRSRY